MGGLFRFKVGVSAAPAPVWQSIPSAPFVFGVAGTFPFSVFVSSILPLTFTATGVYPSGLTVNSTLSRLESTASLALGTYSIQITATDSLNQSTVSPVIQVVCALGTHPPVWNSTSLVSVPQGQTFNLNTLCTDQDAGDSISYTSLLALPTGFSLNGSTGLVSVASSVVVGAYTLRFRGTDLTNRTADSQNLTFSITSAVLQPSISTSIPGFSFTQGIPASISLTSVLTNFNSNLQVVEVSSVDNLGNPTGLPVDGIWIDSWVGATIPSINYNGVSANANSNIALVINNIQQTEAQRSTQRGVFRYIDFNSNASMSSGLPGGGGQGDSLGVIAANNSSPQGPLVPTLDTTLKASGASSLKIVTPVQSDSSTGGDWFTNFSLDRLTQFGAGQIFYFQFRWRCNQAQINQIFAGTPGFKLFNLDPGDQTGCDITHPQSIASGGFCTTSNETGEIVMVNQSQRGVISVYDNHATISSNPWELNIGGGSLNVQNGSTTCLYPMVSGQRTWPYPTNIVNNCFTFVPDNWITFQVEVRLGAQGLDPATSHQAYMNSYARIWGAYEGQKSQLIYNWGPYNLQVAPNKYGKLWFLNYQTTLDPTSVRTNAGQTNYDDLIFSRTRIADPV